MTNDIQRARDVLAKWREKAGQWTYAGDFTFTGEDRTEPCLPLHTQWKSNARLIVGTAGNPDLLDAIDAMLSDRFLRHASTQSQFRQHAERIAAAIIAADKRMNP